MQKGEKKEGRGDAIYWLDRLEQTQTPFVSERSSQQALVACVHQELVAKRRKENMSAFLIPRIPSTVPEGIPAGGFNRISNHECHRGLMEGKISLAHQAMSLFPLELCHGSCMLRCTHGITQLQLLNIDTRWAWVKVLRVLPFMNDSVPVVSHTSLYFLMAEGRWWLVIIRECKACTPFDTIGPEKPRCRASFRGIECPRGLCSCREPGRIPCWGIKRTTVVWFTYLPIPNVFIIFPAWPWTKGIHIRTQENAKQPQNNH